MWKYDLVFPWPEAIAVISDVIGIFNFSLCSAVEKNEPHSSSLSVFSHCLCHFVISYYFSSMEIVIGILLYTIFSSPSSSAASLALPAHSPRFHYVPSPILNEIDQFCVMSCRTLFRMSSIKGLCIKLFVRKAKVTLLSV